MKNNTEVIWKSIEGYEGIYEVSNLGRVRSLDREIINTRGRKYKYKGMVLKNGVDVYGYCRVALSDGDSNQKVHKVHILVARAFIENYDENAVNVTFIDGDKINTRADNLEWVEESITGRKGNSVAGRGRPKQTKEGRR